MVTFISGYRRFLWFSFITEIQTEKPPYKDNLLQDDPVLTQLLVSVSEESLILLGLFFIITYFWAIECSNMFRSFPVSFIPVWGFRYKPLISVPCLFLCYFQVQDSKINLPSLYTSANPDLGKYLPLCNWSGHSLSDPGSWWRGNWTMENTWTRTKSDARLPPSLQVWNKQI